MISRITALLSICLLFALAGCGEERREDRRDERRDDRRDERVENWSDWEKLGERWIHHKGKPDHDTIMVTASEGRFTRMALRCEHSQAEVYDIEVTFGDGDKWSPGTRIHFGEDTRSREIDLPGKARKIKKIVFKYKSKIAGFKGKATINLYGKKA